MSDWAEILASKIETHRARIGIIGLGYVGLPLAVEFARGGFEVTGFDVDSAKVTEINAGRSYIPDVPGSELAAVVAAGKLTATSNMALLGTMDAIDIAVPTPLRKTRDPDLSYVVKAVEAVVAALRAGQLIVLESTTYPGTTDEIVQPMLEARGFKADVAHIHHNGLEWVYYDTDQDGKFDLFLFTGSPREGTSQRAFRLNASGKLEVDAAASEGRLIRSSVFTNKQASSQFKKLAKEVWSERAIEP